MSTTLEGRRRMAIVGGTLLVAVGALVSACGSSGNEAPTTTTTTMTTTATTSPPTSAPAEPSEKNINPTEGNLFTPTVVAPAAPTVPPGQHPGINGIP